jgi:arylsulfatase A-like enzyme
MTGRPNILYIIAHDLGTHLGCYGEPVLHTPALDGLATQGIRLVNHFGTAAFCSPARGGLVTGMYPHSNGLMGLVNLGWDLPPGASTIAQSLGSVGYETFLFGMQHETKHPGRLGFHHISERIGSTSCVHVAPQVDDFLRSRTGTEQQPFYARVGFSEVHRRYDQYSGDRAGDVRVPPFMKDTPGAREDLSMFHGAIEQLDSSVGQILDALEESGQRDNTFVVFTTDHGIAFPRAKGTNYDPGIRTAMLMRWPDGFVGGQEFHEMVSAIDMFPTLHEASGVDIPAHVQGRSYLPLLRGEGFEARTEIFAEKNTSPDDVKRCVRTSRYKFIRNYHEGPKLPLPTDIETSLTRRDMGDEHLDPRPPVELYDLEADPNEFNNLAGNEEMAGIENEMSHRLEQIMGETNDPILEGPVPRPKEEAELLRKAFQKAREVERKSRESQ